MTAIAGIWSEPEAGDPQAAVSGMIAAQQAYGPHDQSVAALHGVGLGRALYQLLPEDRFDRQPVIDPSRAMMLVADIRIDNRDELLRDLGQPLGAEISDAGLLAIAYWQWGEATLDRLVGDFAFAVWDSRRRALILARDTAGQRPLHFHHCRGLVAFASMPQGLFALPQIERRLDHAALAGFVADRVREGTSTFFEGVRRVAPGQVVTLTRQGVESRRYWHRPHRIVRYRNDSDYIEAFREQIDRATRARMRGAGSPIGAHLSAGLDSSGVAATAARLAAPTGERIIGFTSAPRIGFAGSGLAGRISDESGPAAEVAARYSNMDHVIVRPDGVSPLDLLGVGADIYQEPVGHPCNFVWWSAVHDEARARGVSVMLTGEAGNLTISAGNLPILAEFVRAGRWRRWFREARAVAGTGPSWRGVLATSFGPWMPPQLWRLLVKLAEAGGDGDSASLLHPDLRSGYEAAPVPAERGGRPGRDNGALRWQLLQDHEPGNFRKGILARWGIDERDPTADRRLAEFCMSLPAEQLMSGGITRRLARLGFADRLPASILNGPRGYQYADWYEGIDPVGLEAQVAAIEASPAASSLLDVSRLRARIATWPASDWNSMENITRYRLGLLLALSAGRFLAAMSDERVGPAGDKAVAAPCAKR